MQRHQSITLCTRAVVVEARWLCRCGGGSVGMVVVVVGGGKGIVHMPVERCAAPPDNRPPTHRPQCTHARTRTRMPSPVVGCLSVKSNLLLIHRHPLAGAGGTQSKAATGAAAPAASWTHAVAANVARQYVQHTSHAAHALHLSCAGLCCIAESVRQLHSRCYAGARCPAHRVVVLAATAQDTSRMGSSGLHS